MTDASISPLRRRMIEDMTVRNFAPKTQSDYIRWFGTSPAFSGNPLTQLLMRTCVCFSCT